MAERPPEPRADWWIVISFYRDGKCSRWTLHDYWLTAEKAQEEADKLSDRHTNRRLLFVPGEGQP